MADASNDDTAFRDHVRAFATERLAGMAATLDSPEPLPDAAWNLLAEGGFLGATLPSCYGGADLSLRQTCIVLEEFSRIHSALALAVTMTSGPIVNAILRSGTDTQKERMLPAVTAGKLKLAFALTEPEAGSDAGAIRTRAEKVEGGWRIAGGKHYITWGDVADVVQVVAVTDRAKGARGGMSSFLVERGTPGFTVGRTDITVGHDRISELWFDDCIVPDSALLGEVGAGFAIAMESLDEGRLGVAASCIGAASEALRLTILHVKQRQLFGQPLASQQGVRWMIADSAVELESCRALLNEALARTEAGLPITMLASMCKLSASEMVGRVTDRAVQLHGGAGVILGSAVDRLHRQIRHYRIGEGASEVHRMIIARFLLGG
jgi:alkylation response protein AidB-like acyl-CoA dehydrogenase